MIYGLIRCVFFICSFSVSLNYSKLFRITTLQGWISPLHNSRFYICMTLNILPLLALVISIGWMRWKLSLPKSFHKIIDQMGFQNDAL